MKTLVVVFFLLLSGNQLFAQQDQSITIFEDPRIEFYMDRYEGVFQAKAPEFIYRIQLVSTYNRDEAYSVQGRFRNLYPSQSSLLEYRDVKFLVRTGSFTSKTDAEMMLIELRKNFPSSFILPPEKQQ